MRVAIADMHGVEPQRPAGFIDIEHCVATCIGTPTWQPTRSDPFSFVGRCMDLGLESNDATTCVVVSGIVGSFALYTRQHTHAHTDTQQLIKALFGSVSNF